MSLPLNSRYVETVGTDGKYIALRREKVTSRYSLYITKAGDTFERLAFRGTRDPREYYRIADLNPQIPFPDDIPPGTEIRIPA
jgi:nucleoid-associated protein YgaU